MRLNISKPVSMQSTTPACKATGVDVRDAVETHVECVEWSLRRIMWSGVLDALCIALQTSMDKTAHTVSNLEYIVLKVQMSVYDQFYAVGILTWALLPDSWIPWRVKQKRRVGFQCSMK